MWGSLKIVFSKKSQIIENMAIMATWQRFGSQNIESKDFIDKILKMWHLAATLAALDVRLLLTNRGSHHIANSLARKHYRRQLCLVGGMSCSGDVHQPVSNCERNQFCVIPTFECSTDSGPMR